MDGEVLCSTEKPKSTPGPDRIVVFQNGALFPGSNLENVIFGPVMQGKLTRKEAIDKGRAMMADAGLSGVEHNYPGEVSSGMRRRVEIVRALMNEPKALLLDEPYRALDSLTKSVMHEALLEIYYKNKVTIFFITHDLEEAIFFGHRGDHDHAAVQAEEGSGGRHPAPARLQRAHLEALPRADRGDQRRGARGGAQGLPGRGKGRMRKFLSSPALARRRLDRRVPRPVGARRASKQWMAPEFFAPFKELLGAMGFEGLPARSARCPRLPPCCWLAVLASPATGRAGT